jgi:hypothetical protein
MLLSTPNPMDDTLHLHLTHEELKDLLRRRFSRAGLEPPILEAIDEIALLIRRHGFAAVLERLELAVQELSQPPVPPVDFTELFRQNEEAIAAYQARMRAVPPTYQPGDQFEFLGEVYEICRYQREGEPGYWLRRDKDEIFIRSSRKTSCGRCCTKGSPTPTIEVSPHIHDQVHHLPRPLSPRPLLREAPPSHRTPRGRGTHF